MVIEIIEISLWFIAVIICFLIAFVFFLESMKREIVSKAFFRGLSIFALLYGIARLIENIRRYFIGNYNDIFEAWIIGSQITGLNFTLRLFYYIIAWIGISIMYYNIERHIFTKNKYILTLFSIIEALVSIINYLFFNSITFWLAVIIYFIPAYFLPLLFLFAAKKTPSKYLRNGCILNGIGIFLLATAVAMDLPEAAYFFYSLGINTPELIIRIIAPIFLILGMIIFTLGIKTQFLRKEVSE